MAPPVRKKKKLSSANRRLISSALRKIWICTDVLMDILPFFYRRQLGLKLALISPRFDALVDAHFNGKTTELPILTRLTLLKGCRGSEAKFCWFSPCHKSMHFPMPDRPLPNKIRFDSLQIDYIDHTVLAFLRANNQIWDKGTNLHLYVWTHGNSIHIWDVFVREIWPIFATNIRCLTFMDGDQLDNLIRFISPTILFDLNINSVNSGELLPAVIGADFDRPNLTAVQTLSKWLHTPRSDGQPKQLICHGCTLEFSKWINDFKEAFLRATTSSASYKILFEDFIPMEIVPFELVNERTNEMLTLEKGDEDGWCSPWIIKRFQIGQLIQWEDKNLDNLNDVSFMLQAADCIGPLSPQNTDQMNAKKHLKMIPGPSGRKNE